MAAPSRGFARPFYAASSSMCSASPLDAVWNDWIAFEHKYQEENLAQLAQYPLTEPKQLSPHGPRLDVARLRRREDQQPDRRVPLSRDDRLPRPHGSRDRQAHPAHRAQGHDALQGDERRLRSRRPAPLSTPNDNYAFRDINRGRRRHRQEAPNAADGRAHRRPRLQPSRQESSGASATRTASSRWCGFRRPTPASTRSRRSTTARSCSTSTSRPTASCSPPPIGEVDGKQSVRVWKLDEMSPDARAGRPVATLVASALGAGEFHLHAGRQDAARQRLIIPASRTSSASISPRRSMTSSPTPRPASSVRMPQPDGSLLVYDYTGKGFNPSISSRRSSRTSAPSNSSAPRSSTHDPSSRTGASAHRRRSTLDSMITERSTYNSAQRMKLRRTSIRSSRATKAPFRPAIIFHFADPLQFRQFSASFSISPFNQLSTKDRFHAQTAISRRPTGTLRTGTTARTSTTSSGRSSAAAGAMLWSSNTTSVQIYDPPRQLDFFGSAAIYFRPRPTAGRAEHPEPEDRACQSRSGLKYTNTTQGARRRRS